MKRILFGIGRVIGATGRATIALVGICGVVAALANYAVTVGAGTNFGSIVVSTVHYAQQLICDSVTPAQCVSVSAAGAAKVDGSAVTQPVSSATLSTSANQTTINTSIGTTNTNIGSQADAACGTDNGSCSLIALQKRGNQNLTTVNGTAAASVAAGTNRIGYVSDDPCSSKIKTNLPISQNGTSSVQLIALSGATTIYVCAITLVAAGATTVALTTGTGTACVTGNAAVIGTTTASIANSISLAANNGWSQGSGNGTVASGAASSELCMVLGTSVFVSGNLTYVQQ